MASQSRTIDEQRAVAHAAIVPYVRRREKQIPAANGGDPAAFDGATVDGHVLTEGIFIADEQLRSFAAESPILWIAADRAKWMKNIAAPELRRALHHRVGMQDATIAQLHVLADDGVGADLNA